MIFLGEILALSAAVMWSGSSFVFTAAAKRIGALQLNVYRMVIASVLLAATILIFDFDYYVNQYQIAILAISGFLGLVVGDSFLFRAFKESGPKISMLMMSCNPAIAAILAMFILDEYLSVWGIIGIAVTLTGIAVVILEKPREVQIHTKVTKKGIIYGLLAAAGQGTGLVMAKLAYNEAAINAFSATLVRTLAALIIIIPVMLVMRKLKNPVKLFSEDRKSLTLVSVGALIGPYLGITLSFFAIIYTKVGIASTLMSTVPIIMLPLSYFVYKEKQSMKTIGGAFVAVIGVAILFLYDLFFPS